MEDVGPPQTFGIYFTGAMLGQAVPAQMTRILAVAVSIHGFRGAVTRGLIKLGQVFLAAAGASSW